MDSPTNPGPSPELLALLRCPETLQPLSPAPPELLARLKLTAGLLREDGQVVYPIRDGLPFMLVEEGVRVS